MLAIAPALQNILKSAYHSVAPFVVFGIKHEYLIEFVYQSGIEVMLVDGKGPN